MLINCIKAEVAAKADRAGQAPRVLTASAKSEREEPLPSSNRLMTNMLAALRNSTKIGIGNQDFMKERPLRTTVIGSYPFPGWLEFAAQNLDKFRLRRSGRINRRCSDRRSPRPGRAPTRCDNRRRTDSARFQSLFLRLHRRNRSRIRFRLVASVRPLTISAANTRSPVFYVLPVGSGPQRIFRRLQRIAPERPTLKASVPGPYTLSGRLIPNDNTPTVTH